MATTIPTIFSPDRRAGARRRIAHAQRQPDAARFLIDEMVDDALERLAFIRHAPKRALVLGDWSGVLAARLRSDGAEVVTGDIVAQADACRWELEQPYPQGGFDLIACFGLLETANDLPGALIHMHRALAPGGFALAGVIGNGSLPKLRGALIAGDGDRPAARMHPQIDVQAAAQLLQRTGWADPVVDSHALTVRYGSLDRLIADLRAQGLGNALANIGPGLTRSSLTGARAAFAAQADPDGKVTERFEIITLSGRRR